MGEEAQLTQSPAAVVLVEIPCPECDGTGRVHSHNDTCDECKRTGVIKVLPEWAKWYEEDQKRCKCGLCAACREDKPREPRKYLPQPPDKRTDEQLVDLATDILDRKVITDRHATGDLHRLFTILAFIDHYTAEMIRTSVGMIYEEESKMGPRGGFLSMQLVHRDDMPRLWAAYEHIKGVRDGARAGALLAVAKAPKVAPPEPEQPPAPAEATPP